LSNHGSANSRSGVLSGGNWIIDHVKVIDAWPTQDALATILSQSDGNGGGSYNVAKNLSKMQCGFPLSAVGLLGNDMDAQTILSDCDSLGIERSGLRQTDAAPTSFTDVMSVNSTGRRTFFHQHGANALLNQGHFDLAGSRARIFYLGYLGLLKSLDSVDDEGQTGASRLLEEASRQGFLTVADLVSSEVGDFPGVINSSLPHLDFLLLNEYELSRLTATQPAESAVELSRLEACAGKVLERGVRRGVVVHFPQGAFCVAREGPVTRQAAVRLPAEMIRGTAGAGDGFGAGFLYGTHSGWPMKQCLELAVCVAAASLRDATCSAAIEPVENCLQLGQKLGFREPLTIS
jgi:sugar/nucleoside kinase (ribokinase family)